MYVLIKTASIFFCLVPKRFALSIGSCIGYMFFLFSRKKKTQALKNLRLAFPKKPYSELAAITRKSFQNFGMSIIESLRIPREEKSISRGPFIVEGKQYFSCALKDKGILTSIHMGSWELFNISCAHETDYVVLARRQPNMNFDAYLNKQRLQEGLNIVYEDDVRALIRYLKKDYVLGIVFDHGSKDSKIYAEFFGKLIPVPTGPLKLALNLKKKLYPACLTRHKGNRHLVKMFAPVEVKSEDDFLATAKKLNSCYEEFLRQNPENYLWWYKRFKRSKNLNILVLSDAKPGHLRQSKTLASLIEEKRPQSVIETVEIKLGRFRRFIFDAANVFSSRRSRGSITLLRYCLGRDFDRLFRYADVVISCGASLSSLNRMLSYSLDAKSFVVQRPNIALAKHDLVVLPFHDRAADRKNVVKTDGSLSLYDEVRLRESAGRLRKVCSDFSDRNPKLGAFIGGPLEPDYKKELGFDWLRLLKDISLRNNWQLFITTSRRTPRVLEDFLKSNLADVPLLVIANDRNFDFAAAGILGLCDLVLVSSDSISMITESAAAKPTLVCDLFSCRSKKHAEFISSLTRRRYAKDVHTADLEESIKKVLRKEIELKRIDNRAIVAKALDRKL